MVRCATLLAALLSLMAAPLVLAQPAESEAKEERPSTDRPNKEGEYQGVTPGESEVKPRTSRVPKVTWVGFEARADRSSRIFFQLNREVEYEQALGADGVLHLTLVGARFGSRNTIRRMDTSFFDSAIGAVRGKPVRRSRKTGQRAGLKFDLRFRIPGDAQQASITQERASDGYHYLYLEFGPASEKPKLDKKVGPQQSDDAAATAKDDVGS